MRWSGHLQCRPLSAHFTLIKCDSININNRARGKGQPKLGRSVTKKDMNESGLCDDLPLDRTEWRKRTHVANLSEWDKG